VCSVVGCPCGCEGVLSAGEVCRGAEFARSPHQIPGTALCLVGLDGSFGCSQMLCVDLCYNSS